MGYTWYVGDLRTGKISRSVDLVGYSWSTVFDDAGSLSGSFPLGWIDETTGRSLWPDARSDAAPGKQFLAVAYTDANGHETFLAGGPIWMSNFDEDSATLQIGAAGLWSYFDHRKVMSVLAAGANPAVATVTFTGAQLGLIAKQLVELSQSHTGGSLPIVLPDDADLGGAGTDHTRTYPGFELGWVGERLKQLSEVEGGPEIQFTPRRRSDDLRYIEWVMRIGVEPSMMLNQSGTPWTFDHTVSESPVTGISVATDGSNQAFRAWSSGQGDSEGKLIGVFEDLTRVDQGWPLLEDEVTASDNVTVLATLTDLAAERVAAGREPIETWTVKVARDAIPNVGQYSPGDFCVVKVGNHLYLPRHDSPRRILSISGDTSGEVTLSMAPQIGG